MKKVKKYFLYAVLIILAIFNLNTVMNILAYNSMLNAIVEHEVETNFSDGFKFLLPGLIILFNFLISFVFAAFISKLEKKSNKKESEEVNPVSKKERIIFSSIYGLLFIGFNIIFYLKHIKNLSIITEKLLDYSVWDLSYSFVAYALPEINILIIILSCIAIIPAIIKLINIDRKPKREIKFLRPIGNFLIGILCLILVLSNIYFYIDIPEFKYAYYTYPTKELKEELELEIEEEYIELLGFSDYMRNFKEEVVMPDKIWGKDVFYLAGFPDDNIYISGNISWYAVKNIIAYGSRSLMDNNYVLVGNSNEWLIENNQLYNKDKTEMIIRNPKDSDYLYIPSTVEKIGDSILVLQLDKDVVVDENNKYFYSYDGNLYFNLSNYTNAMILSASNMSEEERNEAKGTTMCFVPKNKEEVRLKDDISGSVVILSIGDKDDLIIPETLVNDIYFVGNINDVIVEENNPVYSSIEGHLYNKSGTKLMVLNNEKTEYKIPNSVEEFSVNALFDISKASNLSIELDENNEHFVYEDETLYNKEKTKIIFTKIYTEKNYETDETTYYTKDIDKNLYEIDENFKEACKIKNVEIRYKENNENDSGREMLVYPE